MRRAAMTIFLLIVIICAFLFCICYIAFNLLDSSNSINQTLRKRVLVYPPIRKVMRLEQVGDARYEYMTQLDRQLVISIYYQEGVSLDAKTIAQIPGKIQFATHKFLPIVMNKPQILTGIKDKVENDDINRLLDTYSKDTSLFSQTIPLYIFVLKYYLPHSSYAGWVTDAHSIVLFKTAIDNVAENPDSKVAVETSTILHEFGHLGGAEHITSPDCIMNDTLENLNFYNKITTIRDSYCPEDLQAIQKSLTF